MLHIRPATPADRGAVTAQLARSWGSTLVVAHGTVYDAARLPAILALRDGELCGVLTYQFDDLGMEIVTLDAWPRQHGTGTALLKAAADTAYDVGCSRLWLVTTNDNLDALRFYQRRGLQICAVAVDAMDAARKIKPNIPTVGQYGIPITDELTLETWVS